MNRLASLAVVSVLGAGAVGPHHVLAGTDGLATATFAGGCFWCVEADFDSVPGVVKTVSGYTGGTVDDPTYEQVTAGGTGHREAVRIHYDPERISYERLLHVFWRSVDPTDAGGQFCDRGVSYRTAIFTGTEDERRLASESRDAIERSGVLEKEVVTTIEPLGKFFPAEDHHQDYYTRNPIRYRFYRLTCRRDARVREVWGDQAHRGIPGH